MQMAKQYMKKMLTIPGYKGNKNQNHTKITPHPCYNGFLQQQQQQQQQQQMLVRIRGKRKSHTLLVET
jgi:hypothetical protein